MLPKKTTIACVVLGALFAARAHAQPDPDSETKPLDAAAASAGGEGGDQLTLQKGRAILDAFVEIGLSNGAAFKPVSISPDIWYGVTDDITAGVVHSATGASGFIGGVGDSLCLTGATSGCPDFYRNVGFEGRYRIKMGGIALAADGGLYVLHLTNPMVLSLKAGAIGRWHSGPLAIEASPNLFFGLTNRSSVADFLNLPATALYAVTPAISVAAQVGIVLPFESTGDAYALPLSIGAHYHVNDQLNVSVAFSLPRLVGGGSGNGVDFRSLTLGGSYAF
jgi:hypothetical protein